MQDSKPKVAGQFDSRGAANLSVTKIRLEFHKSRMERDACVICEHRFSDHSKSVWKLVYYIDVDIVSTDFRLVK